MDGNERLARTLKAAQWRHHRALDSRLRRRGSSLSQWDALRAIAATPAASGHDLAQATFQSDQALGTLVGRLVRDGLVERRPGRGRRVEHHLTDAGRTVLADGRGVAHEVFRASFAGLDADERTQLLDLLERVNGALTPPVDG